MFHSFFSSQARSKYLSCVSLCEFFSAHKQDPSICPAFRFASFFSSQARSKYLSCVSLCEFFQLTSKIQVFVLRFALRVFSAHKQGPSICLAFRFASFFSSQARSKYLSCVSLCEFFQLTSKVQVFVWRFALRVFSAHKQGPSICPSFRFASFFSSQARSKYLSCVSICEFFQLTRKVQVFVWRFALRVFSAHKQDPSICLAFRFASFFSSQARSKYLSGVSLCEFFQLTSKVQYLSCVSLCEFFQLASKVQVFVLRFALRVFSAHKQGPSICLAFRFASFFSSQARSKYLSCVSLCEFFQLTSKVQVFVWRFALRVFSAHKQGPSICPAFRFASFFSSQARSKYLSGVSLCDFFPLVLTGDFSLESE